MMDNADQKKSVLAWHFLPDNERLRFDERIKPEIGEKLVYEGPLQLCEKGFHASLKPLDALTYAPGSVICRVEMSGTMFYGDDKLVASERTIIWKRNIEQELHEFACQCAEDSLHLIPEQSRDVFKAAVDAKRAWLRREISDSDLKAAGAAAGAAARAAARAAAGDAAGAAAWAAAWDAAWDAARAAAGAAARAAAGDAAGAAAWDAAWDAARAAAGDAAGAAAWDAAWDAARAAAGAAAGAAAWAAARAEQNKRLEAILVNRG